MARFNDDEKPPTLEAAGNRIGLVTMKKPTYSKKNVGLTADSLTVGVELNATPSAVAREGLDLVVVMDIGTWEPGQERILKMKKALEFVVMKLTPMDRLSVVTSGDPAGGRIDRLCPLRCVTPAAQSELKALISGLTNCWVNIKRSYEVALSIIQDRVHTESRTASIFYVTDDYEHSGDARSVDPGSVAVHTFGFGTRAGHELLKDMAKKSLGGTYSFVPVESNLCEPFSHLLGGLVTVVAQDVQLTLTTKQSKDAETTMVLSPGIDYSHTSGVNARGDQQIVVSFGTIFSGESRKVLLHFTLNPSKNRSKFRATLAEAQHSYKAQDGEETGTPKVISIPRIDRPSAGAAPSIDTAELQAEELRHQHADTIGAAVALADSSKLDDARYKLQDGLNSLENVTLPELDDGERMVGVLRAELLQLIKLMASPELYKDHGRPYAFAVVSCHGRQRSAAKGVEEPALCLYITPRMLTYLKQAKQFDKDTTAPLPSADQDVKEEMAANPLAAVTGPLAFYLENAIQSLQAIQKILVPANV